MRFSKIFVLYAYCLFLSACSTEKYDPEHNNQFAVYSVIENGLPIEIQLFQTIRVGDSPNNEAVEKVIEIFENDLLVYSDTTFKPNISTQIIPKLGNLYRIEVMDINGNLLKLSSREIKVLNPPEIISYSSNDSIAPAFANTTQTLQQFEVILDPHANNSPYYAYELWVDSLPFKEESPINVTGSWFPRSGYNCPEIAESPFIDKNFRIVNFTCFEIHDIFSLETTNHRPGDFDFLRLTLCNLDDHTMDFARWISQIALLQPEGGIVNIFSTKDNFRGENGYDFVLSRSCNEFLIVF